MARPITVLLSGCGSIGKRHYALVKEICQDQRWAADIPLYDPKLTTRLPAPTFAETLAQVEPTHVLICSPPRFHIEQLDASIRAGVKHIFVEKPVALSQAHMNTLHLRIPADVRVQVGYQFRFIPWFGECKGVIEQAYKTGTPIVIRMRFGHAITKWHDDINPYTERIGILLEGSHELDIAWWWFDQCTPLKQISGVLYHEDLGCAEHTAKLIFNSGYLYNMVELHLDYTVPEYTRFCTINVDGQRVAAWEYEKEEMDLAYYRQMTEFLFPGTHTMHQAATLQDSYEVLGLIDSIKRNASWELG